MTIGQEQSQVPTADETPLYSPGGALEGMYCNPHTVQPCTLSSAKSTASTNDGVIQPSQGRESAGSTVPGEPLLKLQLSSQVFYSRLIPTETLLAPYRQGNEVVTGQIQDSSFRKSGLKDK